MLLTRRKRKNGGLLAATKAARSAAPTPVDPSISVDHDRQSAVVDAVEWAVERWETREWATDPVADPRPLHCQRLIAALGYLDRRFTLLAPEIVIAIIDRVVPGNSGHTRAAELDAKAAALLLMVEVGAFRR